MRYLMLTLSFFIYGCLVPSGLFADGELDPTFGAEGVVLVDLGRLNDCEVADMLIQPDGRIVVAGSCLYSGLDWDFGVTRLNKDGTPDTSFNGTGSRLIVFDLDGNFRDRANVVALRPGGQITLAGMASSSNAFAQLAADGSLDTSFDLDGKYAVEIDGGYGVPQGIDGSAQSPLKVIRATELDLRVYETYVFDSFPEATQATLIYDHPGGEWSQMFGLSEGRNERQYYVGWNDGNLAFMGFITFLGVPDPAFGTQGWKTIQAQSSGGDWGSRGNVVSHYPGNRVIAGGVAFRTNPDGFVVRTQYDGSPDTSFGVNGQQYLAWNLGGGNADEIHALAVQGDGHTVFGATSADAEGRLVPHIARLDVQGAYDTTFADVGWLRLPDPPGYELDGKPSIALQRDGFLIVAGTARSTDADGYDQAYVMRLVSSHVLFADGFESGSLSAWAP